MTSKSDALQASFPWLTSSEASMVADALDRLPTGKSVADQMTSIADHLEELGLPPTSSLLLALAGRGSKGTAVAIARSTARRRFENAGSLPLATTEQVPAAAQPTVPTEMSQLFAHLERLQAPSALDGLGNEILRELGAFRSEFAWLKSCIDTERQLRKHEEKVGALPEPRAPTSTPASRAHLVATVSSGLERVRYKAPDQADGAIE